MTSSEEHSPSSLSIPKQVRSLKTSKLTGVRRVVLVDTQHYVYYRVNEAAKRIEVLAQCGAQSSERLRHCAPPNFTLKLVRPGAGPAAELPPLPQTPWRRPRHARPAAQLSVRSVSASRTRRTLCAVGNGTRTAPPFGTAVVLIGAPCRARLGHSRGAQPTGRRTRPRQAPPGEGPRPYVPVWKPRPTFARSAPWKLLFPLNA